MLHQLLRYSSSDIQEIIKCLKAWFAESPGQSGNILLRIINIFASRGSNHLSHFEALLFSLDKEKPGPGALSFYLKPAVEVVFEQLHPTYKQGLLSTFIKDKNTLKRTHYPQIMAFMDNNEEHLRRIFNARNEKSLALELMGQQLFPSCQHWGIQTGIFNYKAGLPVETYYLTGERHRCFEATLFDIKKSISHEDLSSIVKPFQTLYADDERITVAGLDLPDNNGISRTVIVTLMETDGLTTLREWCEKENNRIKRGFPSAVVTYVNKKNVFIKILAAIAEFRQKLRLTPELKTESYGYLNLDNIMLRTRDLNIHLNPTPIIWQLLQRRKLTVDNNVAVSHLSSIGMLNITCLSPEVRSGKYTAKTDVYNMGVIWEKIFEVDMDVSDFPYCEEITSCLDSRPKRRPEFSTVINRLLSPYITDLTHLATQVSDKKDHDILYSYAAQQYRNPVAPDLNLADMLDATAMYLANASHKNFCTDMMKTWPQSCVPMQDINQIQINSKNMNSRHIAHFPRDSFASGGFRFMNCNLAGAIGNVVTTLTDCSISYPNTRHSAEISGAFSDFQMQNLQLDGSSTQPIRVAPTLFKHVNASKNTWRGVDFILPSDDVMSDVSFNHSSLDSVLFSSLPAEIVRKNNFGMIDSSLRNMRKSMMNIEFNHITADSLVFADIDFKKTFFYKPKIQDFTAIRCDFSEAYFDDDYEAGDIKLNKQQFNNWERMYSRQEGAQGDIPAMFDSINNIKVKKDFAQQMVQVLIDQVFVNRRTVIPPAAANGLLQHLTQPDYQGAECIRNFCDKLISVMLRPLSDRLLSDYPVHFRSICADYLMKFSAKSNHRLKYQFLAYQLYKQHPELKQNFSIEIPQIQAAREYISGTLGIDEPDDFHWVFIHHRWRSATGVNGFYLSPDAVHSLQQHNAFDYSHIIPIGVDEEMRVLSLPAEKSLNDSICSRFPFMIRHFKLDKETYHILDALLNIDNLPGTVTETLTSSDIIRLTVIHSHINALVHHKPTTKMELTALADEILLKKALHLYFDVADKDNSSAKRDTLLATACQHPALNSTGDRLRVNQQKAILSLSIADFLIKLASNYYCGSEYLSPTPLRALAHAFLGDLRHLWPELVASFGLTQYREDDQLKTRGRVEDWQERLLPTNKTTFPCAAMVSSDISAAMNATGLVDNLIWRRISPL
ncbi:MAG: hypothetical protein QM578_04710 [Pantoea sp.]|uniref:hypothetical protein n=1 Tax=Pantoea sp. TaxID=69393 RepID=UPI0039E293A3